MPVYTIVNTRAANWHIIHGNICEKCMHDNISVFIFLKQKSTVSWNFVWFNGFLNWNTLKYANSAADIVAFLHSDFGVCGQIDFTIEKSPDK